MDFLRTFAYLNRTESFPGFCKYMIPTFKFTWFHDYMMERIDSNIRTKRARLIIKMPPQHGKTLIAGVLLSAYIFGRFPEKKNLYTSYGEKIAGKMAADTFNMIVSKRYQEIFPDAKVKTLLTDEEMRKRKNRKKQKALEWVNVNSERGEFKADSIWGAIASYSADNIIVDDYFKNMEEADSPVLRDKLWDIFFGVIQARSQTETNILVFCTPWHTDDLIGRLEHYNKYLRKEGAPKWEIIEFPAEVVEEITNDYDKRKMGDFLWPEERLHLYYEAMANPKTWNAEYLLKPLNQGGVLFQREWFIPFDTYPNNHSKILISVDTNFNKRAKKGDKCAITVWKEVKGHYYLVEFFNRRVDFIETVREVERLMSKYPDYWAVVVELKANGAALVDLLRQKWQRIIDFDPANNTKLQRAEATVPLFYESRIHVPSVNLYPEINIYLKELLSFTGVNNNEEDNLVDSSTQALLTFMKFCRVVIEATHYGIKSPNYNLLYNKPQILERNTYDVPKLQSSKFLPFG